MEKEPLLGSVDGDETHQNYKRGSSLTSVQEYRMNFNPLMKVNFNGGDLTSDAGLLLYKSFDHTLGLSRAVEELLVVNDAVVHRDHPNSDVVIQKIYQHIGGYHTDDHADDLHAEPLLQGLWRRSGKYQPPYTPHQPEFNFGHCQSRQ